MKKNLLLIVAVLFALSNNAFAQDFSFGVKAGLNLAKMNEKDGSVKKSTSSKVGLVLGGYVDCNFTDMIALESGLSFEQKGGKSQETDQYGTETNKDNINYFTVPINFRVNLPVADNNLYFLAGPTFGLALGGNTKIDETAVGGGTTSQTYTYVFGSAVGQMKRMNVGMLIGAGFELSNNIGFRLSYDIGLTNLYNSVPGDTSTEKTTAFQIAVTYKFK